MTESVPVTVLTALVDAPDQTCRWPPMTPRSAGHQPRRTPGQLCAPADRGGADSSAALLADPLSLIPLW